MRTGAVQETRCMPAKRYSIPSIVLHWAMALAILLAWVGMQVAEQLVTF